MAKKDKTVFVCSECGFESSKWNGRCQSCGMWNTFEEQAYVPTVASASAAKNTLAASTLKMATLKEIETLDEVRYLTGTKELDRVLGGGLVKGSLVLVGGEPGIGKSTLLLQICQYMGKEHSILYVSGEESARQIKLRAQRLNVDTESLYIMTVTDAPAVCGAITSNKPDIVIIDSIQTMSIEEIPSAQGSLRQVRECTNLFMKTAKELEIPIFIVGHVNKDGDIAGPKVMEHIVDAVLHFEGERHLSYRILRAVKNRFGSTNEIGVFEMADIGLREVPEPSMMLLSGRPKNVSGNCIACIMEGSRPILAEVQALAAKSSFAVPRRTATGFDFSRLAILLAVLEKRCGVCCGTLDVYLNIVGGFRFDEPAGDLPVAIAVYSAIMDKPVPDNLIAIGEVGLGGEVRNITRIQQRIAEAQRMGFEKAIIPVQSLKNLNPDDYDIDIIGVASLKQAFTYLDK
ncbi:MAG: DNA repair protein RadA [Oscillospiraceae bacterium]|nr:DNA repair protein RadA [Oscillospiraceae bacterium]